MAIFFGRSPTGESLRFKPHMSHSALPKLEKFVRQLLEFELAGPKSDDTVDRAAFRVCARLQGPLGKLLGLAGFRALRSRALALAAADHPWLSKLSIKDDGSLDDFAAVHAEPNSTARVQGGVTMVAHLLGLLVTFIGSSLTLVVVKESWPKADCDALTFEK